MAHVDLVSLSDLDAATLKRRCNHRLPSDLHLADGWRGGPGNNHGNSTPHKLRYNIYNCGVEGSLKLRSSYSSAEVAGAD